MDGFILLFLFLCIARVSGERCTDFNAAAARSAAAGLTGTYVCPDDGIGKVSCNEGLPSLKETGGIVDSRLSWNDILVFLPFHATGREELMFWWLNNFYRASEGAVLDIVLIANACAGGAEQCEDDAIEFSMRLGKVSGVHASVVRAFASVDAGYFRLACKILTGIHKIFDLYPTKKYFFKIDDDTVLFPGRLLRMINTLDSAAGSDTTPLLFGTILNDHKPSLLCEGTFCYPQGGAGYGMNNAAIRALTNKVYNWPCTAEMDLERVDEDGYVGFRLFRDNGTAVIHCGGLRPHGGNAEAHLPYALSFHHVHHDWIQLQNLTRYWQDYNLH